MKKVYKESELILNPDGSIYHIKLKPENIAQKVIVVGDQGRVETVSKHFEKIEHKSQNREFVTHTGYFNGKRITVMSTGIGTDNIDIAINELDAAVNIDLEKRIAKDKHTSLDIIRIGTSGALQADIEVDSFVASTHGMGFDGLLNFYDYKEGITEDDISNAFIDYAKWGKKLTYPYVVKGSDMLLEKIAHGLKSGITATASGFYGPQGRELRIPLSVPDLNEKIENFNYNGHRITNFEMETSALYGLGKILGHNTLTICAIIANRLAKTYSKDYKKSVETLIKLVLERFTSY
ncbi:MAG: nucleoside phosphorylase [Bacteroidetes bacterium]|nr:nucleoside phosphorylase [Bacteroidota bacterium]